MIEEFLMENEKNKVTDFFFEVMSQTEDVYEQLAFYQALKESNLINKLDKAYFREEMLESLEYMDDLTERAQAFEEYQSQFMEDEEQRERENQEKNQQIILTLLHEAIVEICGDEHGKVPQELITTMFSSLSDDDEIREKRQQVLDYVNSRLPENIKEVTISVEFSDKNENELLQ